MAKCNYEVSDVLTPVDDSDVSDDFGLSSGEEEDLDRLLEGDDESSRQVFIAIFKSEYMHMKFA